jgi:hypothetical protein
MNNSSTITISIFLKNDNSIEMMGMAKKLSLSIHNLNKRAYFDFLKSGGAHGINYKQNEGLTLVIDNNYALMDSNDFYLKDAKTEESDINQCADLILEALRSVQITLPEFR